MQLNEIERKRRCLFAFAIHSCSVTQVCKRTNGTNGSGNGDILLTATVPSRKRPHIGREPYIEAGPKFCCHVCDPHTVGQSPPS
jgi:hypothetical protein